MQVRISVAVLGAIIFGAVALVFAGGGSTAQGSPAACKAAMEQMLSGVIARSLSGQPVVPGTKPPQCDNLTDAQLNSIGQQVLSGH